MNFKSFEKVTNYYKFLTDCGIKNNKILLNYFEPHRYFHTFEHIEYMLNKILFDENFEKYFDVIDNYNSFCNIYLAVLFHDIIYDPKRSDNEDKSADLLLSLYDKSSDKNNINIDLVCQMIRETKTHKPTSIESNILCDADLLGLKSDDIDFIKKTEEQIRQEYQHIDFEEYISKRIEVLKDLGANQLRIDYVKSLMV